MVLQQIRILTFLGGGTGLCRLLVDSTSDDMDDILSVERPFDRRTPCIGLGVGGGGPRGRCMLPDPDKLLLLPTFVLSNAAEVVLRDGGSPAGMTSFAPGAATYEYNT
jgi:hypothetical protein